MRVDAPACYTCTRELKGYNREMIPNSVLLPNVLVRREMEAHDIILQIKIIRYGELSRFAK